MVFMPAGGPGRHARQFRDGAITLREFRAAEAFRQMYERAQGGALTTNWPSTDADPQWRHDGADDPVTRQLLALRWIARVSGDLGPVLWTIVIALIVHKACSREIGDLFDVDRGTGKQWAILAVRALALAQAIQGTSCQISERSTRKERRFDLDGALEFTKDFSGAPRSTRATS
jgi:hypothetical protein